MRDMHGLRVVITGASSGVGRVTAHAFAEQGAYLALAARSPEPLRDTARECEELGGRAITVPTDVAVPDAVRHLAGSAATAFGGIDVWINNAGLGAVGRFDRVPIEAHRRVIETNLLGYMYGAHAVLPHFIEQGHGILINNISIGGFMPTPYAAAYAASKFGARAFSYSLRQEVRRWPDIHVCALYPYFMDTPGAQHSGNYTGRELKPAPPVYGPEVAADAIVDLVRRPRREVVVGLMAKLGKLEYQVLPGLAEWMLARGIEGYLYQARPSPITPGNLYEPMPDEAGLYGDWRWSAPRSPWAGAALALGVAAGVGALAYAASRREPD